MRQALQIGVLWIAACSSGGNTHYDNGSNTGDSDLTGSFDRRAMVASVGEHVILPAYEAFQTSADALDLAVGAWADSVGAGGDFFAERDGAQTAFKDAYIRWQWIEVLQIGPAGNSSRFVGGQGIRDTVYSWPTTNACRVDQILYSQDFKTEDFFERELVNAFGLDALGYLLFVEGSDNACAAPVALNRAGEWASLSSGELAVRRSAYAARLAERIATQARQLSNLWSPGGANFLSNLQTAGTSGSVYSTAQQAVDQLFASMFYVERQVKDLKLAAPLGVSGACTSRESCPELVESPHARLSLDAIRANLEAFEAVFLGAAAEDSVQRSGFDDFLLALGAEELATTITNDIAATRTALDAINGTLTDALNENHPSVLAAYDALKRITDVLKSELVSVLNLRVPNEGAGDND